MLLLQYAALYLDFPKSNNSRHKMRYHRSKSDGGYPNIQRLRFPIRGPAVSNSNPIYPFCQPRHSQSKNPISSSMIPFSPLCGPLLTGGHSSALCLSFSASARACGSCASLPCTTYSCSASASASSTWWLSSRVSLGTTMMGTPVRRASRIEPEPVECVLAG